MATSKKRIPKKAAARPAVAKKAVAKTTASGSPAAKKATVGTTRKVVAKKAPATPTRAPARPAATPKPATTATIAPTKRRRQGKVVTATAEERAAMIREAAYYRAEKHNFDPSYDDQNWAEAEREVDEILSKHGS